MDSIFLLYLLAFIPVKGVNSGVIITTRDALFIQLSIKQDYEAVKAKVEKKVPKPLVYAASAYKMGKDKEIRFKTRDFGTWQIRKNSVQFTWAIAW